MNILMLHGVNHNMFGQRDPAQYGTVTLDQINAALTQLGQSLGANVTAFQTNHEGAMCERIHQAAVEKTDAVLINAGAWTHTSVDMSNIHAREPFRHVSMLSAVVTGQVVGFGVDSYLLALRAAVSKVSGGR